MEVIIAHLLKCYHLESMKIIIIINKLLLSVVPISSKVKISKLAAVAVDSHSSKIILIIVCWNHNRLINWFTTLPSTIVSFSRKKLIGKIIKEFRKIKKMEKKLMEITKYTPKWMGFKGSMRIRDKFL